MGLTHTLTCGAQATIRQAKSLGIQFSDTAIWNEEFSPKADFPALFSNGILFLNDNSRKEDAFASFIGHLQQKPEKNFVDDKVRNVTALGATFKMMGINYTGLHYTAI